MSETCGSCGQAVPTETCPAVMEWVQDGMKYTYQCVLQVNHGGVHRDADWGRWQITGMVPAMCGVVRDGRTFDSHPCVLTPGHVTPHIDRNGDDWGPTLVQCGYVRGLGMHDNYPCIGSPGHRGDHVDRDGDEFSL